MRDDEELIKQSNKIKGMKNNKNNIDEKEIYKETIELAFIALGLMQKKVDEKVDKFDKGYYFNRKEMEKKYNEL